VYVATRFPSPIPDRFALAHSILGRWPLFAAGIGAAATYVRAGDRVRRALAARTWMRAGGADAVLVAVVVALDLLLRWVVARGPLLREWTPYAAWHLVEAPLWAALVLLLLLAPLRTKPLLSNALLEVVGVLSYSIYLLHTPVMVAMMRLRASLPAPLAGGRPIASALAATVACLAVSALTYRWIERPCLARTQRVAGAQWT
jgi:peptidoglycan/LPS O-acetylase OafA/YrhL